MSDWRDSLDADERERWELFVEHFRRDGVEKIAGSSAFVSLFPRSGEFDVKYAVELGAAIMFSKPILVVVGPGAALPPKLEQLADKVVYADIDTTEGRETLAEEIRGWNP